MVNPRAPPFLSKAALGLRWTHIYLSIYAYVYIYIYIYINPPRPFSHLTARRPPGPCPCRRPRWPPNYISISIYLSLYIYIQVYLSLYIYMHLALLSVRRGSPRGPRSCRRLRWGCVGLVHIYLYMHIYISISISISTHLALFRVRRRGAPPDLALIECCVGLRTYHVAPAKWRGGPAREPALTHLFMGRNIYVYMYT